MPLEEVKSKVRVFSPNDRGEVSTSLTSSLSSSINEFQCVGPSLPLV